MVKNLYCTFTVLAPEKLVLCTCTFTCTRYNSEHYWSLIYFMCCLFIIVLFNVLDARRAKDKKLIILFDLPSLKFIIDQSSITDRRFTRFNSKMLFFYRRIIECTSCIGQFSFE